MRRYGFRVDMSRLNNPFIDIRQELGVPAVIYVDGGTEFRSLALAALSRVRVGATNDLWRPLTDFM